ncbi:hypothetical protein [uncultured Thiohalocapsa sp.]|uniref:hypothetical protein n=1 Tax=uncultured Thiohalocapsa sp. TaxID=768990 RepID=UPI0025CD81B8|nr:hypothetical protein [uncultured Thiohalocapsa sp.]
MDAVSILARAAFDGLSLTAEPAGKLRLRGPSDARARWLPMVRAHKADLLRLLAEPEPTQRCPPPLAPETEAALVRWLDAINETDAQIRAEFLLSCRRDPDGLSGILRLAADRGMVPAPPVPAPAPPAITCGSCLHFRADEVGDGSGLGACGIGAPASRRTPALWPNAPHLCTDHEGTAP